MQKHALAVLVVRQEMQALCVFLCFFGVAGEALQAEGSRKERAHIVLVALQRQLLRLVEGVEGVVPRHPAIRVGATVREPHAVPVDGAGARVVVPKCPRGPAGLPTCRAGKAGQ